MQIRSTSISSSILAAISADPDNQNRRSLKARLFRLLASFWSIFHLPLSRYRAADFLDLRHNVWHLDEQEYAASFQLAPRAKKGKGRESDLKPVGDLGYSGSTFFTTADGKFLVKSLPRRFEHEFFTHDLFDAYVSHMKSHPNSLLVRITDMAYTSLATIGGILGTAPTHHIIMENLLYGKDAEESDERKNKWETYDLKPNDYFFPERDILDGKLAPESVKDRLIDEFPDRVRVSADQKQELLRLLEADTKVLAENNAVDYSLFLVRYPGPNVYEGPREIPSVQSDAHPWRTGLVDADGNWTYRVIVLDFFWAKHKFRAKAMTGLVKSFNVFAKHGPMSITANPTEYRERFLKMVREIVTEA
ncbi:putative phosphatidylinositol phosphate kinase [Colletotrichum chlorophyti]|uniref:Putative phosphatidylinositol phosphate kinase n=1 Tax=Colletotrichum chlorophyti TaxID=708187 RepID=A0A1Q8S4N3_9PEZI|nr:putative phosphatidylinositol phosphate kinase [Colletotrichum chlorophyti]